MSAEDGSLAAQVVARRPALRLSQEELAELAGVSHGSSARWRPTHGLGTACWWNAKNLSVRQEHDGEWRVAPAYDLRSTLPYGDDTMALSMTGRTANLSRRLLLEFATDVGVPNAAAVRVLDRLLERTADLADRFEAAGPAYDPRTWRTVRRGLAARRRLALGD